MIHVAGHVLGAEVNGGVYLRQRCIWCGAALIDQNLSQTAIAVDPADPNPNTEYPTWVPGSWIEKDGGAAWVESIDFDEGFKNEAIRQASCLAVPVEATA